MEIEDGAKAGLDEHLVLNTLVRRRSTFQNRLGSHVTPSQEDARKLAAPGRSGRQLLPGEASS